MNLRQNLSIVLAAVALAAALVQMIHPFGTLIHPGLMFIVAVLLGLRWLVQREARRRRAAILQDVPEHPLGISDDPPR